ncbi:MAG: two-component regulator propeller domain-containing protein, partial [Woeseiaceae bacterium]|nr:two-component regulator propeller domain-containing protein [Woeseiaceae bacterium]
MLLAFVFYAHAAVAGSEAHPMRFEHLTLDDGLSQSSVISIHQDATGFMWFGTENGLNRYNGYEFDSFRRERGNAAALRNDFIFALAESADGTLWVGTNGGGLARLDGDRNVVRNYLHDPADPHSIGGNVVRALALAQDGSLWVGLRDGGIDRFDPASGRFERVAVEGTPSVFALHEDSAGRVWAGTDTGLLRIDPASGKVTVFRHAPADATSLSGDQVRAVFEDAAGNLWVGTRNAGLNRFDAARGSFVRFRHAPGDSRSIASDRVTAILEDDAGRLWIGTATGLNLMDREAGTFTRFGRDLDDAASLGADSVAALYQDRSGILWVGTLTGGVSKWNPRTWGLGLREGTELVSGAEARPNVTSFATRNESEVWIGTFGDGLIRLDRKTGRSVHYRHDPADPGSISDDRVMSLAFGRDGSLWIGTMRGGLNRLDPASGDVTVFRHDAADPTSLSADGVMAIFEDSRGLVWVGTFGGGISVYDPAAGRFARHAADPARPGNLTSNRVTSFAEDTNGRIWVGTDAGGLNVYEAGAGRFTAFRYDAENPRSLSDDTVYSLHVDAEGRVWVGTRGGGLDRVVGDPANPERVVFDNLSHRDGLANDVVYGIQSGARSELWLSTNYGISRFDTKTGEIRNLHRQDGLQSEEFNFGAHHRSAGGELFFGGHNGFNVFDPAALETDSAAPPVILTGFYKANDPVKEDLPSDPEEGIELGYRDDNVSFEFAALDYSSPQNNRYTYKLEGFDEEWIELGTRRRVTYTDLDAGNYLLRVRAANSDGVWNEAGLSLPVRVKPAPWETWWAYLGYAAMAVQLALFLWFGHQRKLRREEEYSHRLELEVRQRTSELAQRNNELRELNECLQESSLSDPLTGLRNRRFVFEEVSRDLTTIARKYSDEKDGLDHRNAADLVFMMIDLDNFKPINDTYGHAAGDKMLLDIRDVLLRTCRRSDFVIRWGGDEFVVIAKQAHPGEAEALAERIRCEIETSEFVLPEGQIVRTTCSIGFAAFPLFRGQAEKGNLDDVINLADSLMYEAKSQRNAWVGMLGINEAVTSAGFENESIEPTS